MVLVGCGKRGGGVDEKIVAASFYPMYIAALNITENAPGVRVAVVASAIYGCAHDYQLTPQDAAIVETASALVVNGGGMDAFLDRAAASNKNLTVIDASDNVKFVFGPKRDHGHHQGNDHDDAVANAHVWMSIENHIYQVQNILKGLVEWDTANAEIYAENAFRYMAELGELENLARRELSGAAGQKIVVSHDGFLYVARDFGLTVTAIVEKEHGVEPSAADVAGTIAAIKKERPRALFVENTRRSPAIKTIAEETGLPVFELDMAAGGLYTKDAYIRAMEKNIATLKKALE